MRKLRDLAIFQPPTMLCSQFFDDDEDSGDGGSSLTEHIFDQVATLTNTALLRNSNPVNAAILTNTPISTPYVTTGVMGGIPQGSLMTFGFLALAAVAIFAGIRYAEK